MENGSSRKLTPAYLRECEERKKQKDLDALRVELEEMFPKQMQLGIDKGHLSSGGGSFEIPLTLKTAESLPPREYLEVILRSILEKYGWKFVEFHETATPGIKIQIEPLHIIRH